MWCNNMQWAKDSEWERDISSIPVTSRILIRMLQQTTFSKMSGEANDILKVWGRIHSEEAKLAWRM